MEGREGRGIRRGIYGRVDQRVQRGVEQRGKQRKGIEGGQEIDGREGRGIRGEGIYGRVETRGYSGGRAKG